MTEFPALRDALIAAAARRRRRRRRIVAAAPTFAITAAVVAVLLVPVAPERERTVTPPAPTATVKPYAQQTLEEAFAVFRRKQTAADRMPAARLPLGTPDATRTRLLEQGGPRRFFAAQVATREGQAVCLVAVRRGRMESATCGTATEAIDESTPLRIGVGRITGVFLPDSSTDLRFIYPNGVGSVSARNNLSLVMSPSEPLSGTSWTGGSGTRYIQDLGVAREFSAPPPETCPKRLGPLPADAVARARRAALIAIDRLYPQALRGTVSEAARATGTPCSAAITDRSIEVTLHLERKSANVAQGRLLLGMQDGYMRVFYLLR
jgi:hypothetical protein